MEVEKETHKGLQRPLSEYPKLFQCLQLIAGLATAMIASFAATQQSIPNIQTAFRPITTSGF